MNREDVANDLAVENNEILRGRLEQAEALLNDARQFTWDLLSPANLRLRIDEFLASQQGEQPECGCCGKTGPCDPDCDTLQHPEQAEGAQGEREAFEAHESKERRLSPADQKFWFRRGVLADYDCKAIDDAWKAWKARAAMATPCPKTQWADFDDWLVWELERDSNQQFEYPAYAIRLARRAFKCAQLQPASELEQSANFLADERDIAQMIAAGMAEILKAIAKNRNATIPPEVHQSISEVLDIYGVHFPELTTSRATS